MIRDRSHSLFPVIVLTLLAGVSVWLDRVTQQDPVAKTDKTRHEADFSAERITLHRFDPTGKKLEALNSAAEQWIQTEMRRISPHYYAHDTPESTTSATA